MRGPEKGPFIRIEVHQIAMLVVGPIYLWHPLQPPIRGGWCISVLRRTILEVPIWIGNDRLQTSERGLLKAATTARLVRSIANVAG